MSHVSDRFRTVFLEDAQKANLPGADEFHKNAFGWLLYDYSTDPPILVGDDIMEPEDALLVRNLKWVVTLLNEINNERR